MFVSAHKEDVNGRKPSSNVFLAGPLEFFYPLIKLHLLGLLFIRAVHKGRPHKIAKNLPLPLVRKMSALSQTSPPRLCGHTINFWKTGWFLYQKVRMSTSEEPPYPQNVRTGQTPSP